MHATKGGWAGQAFALAASNDSGGRKSRIRRSKEERKGMVESFVKNYQKANEGNFPSLNLAHKEVGGSFYTVREIVREIIQENRVLAPPKRSLEEDGDSGFLEQHPLGSISMEPQIDLSERSHMVTHVHDKCQVTSEEDISSSGVRFSGSYPLELDDEQSIEGVSKLADKDEGSDRTSESHRAPNYNQNTGKVEVSSCDEQLPQPTSHKLENEKIVNGFEVLEENPLSDKPLITKVDHQDNNDIALLSSQEFSGSGTQRLGNEQYHNKNDHTVDKTKEFGQRISTDSAVMEILDREKSGAQDVESSQAVKSHMNSDIVVETFPLRPLPRTIHNMDEESGKLEGTAEILEDKAIQSSPCFVNEKDEEKLLDSTAELHGEHKNLNVVPNLQGAYLESSKYSSASKPSVLDIGEDADLESKDSLPDGNKASSSTSENSTAVGTESSDQDYGSLPKGNNPMLDRINLLAASEVQMKKRCYC